MSALPVNVLTGFLGSGKTTLLTRLLREPLMAGAVVLVNEFGEIGLDHELLEAVTETALLLENGCICCTVRGDLCDALRDLLDRRERGQLPAFDRVVVETSGLADPVPIAYTVLTDPILQHHFRLGQMVVTVDAVNITAQLHHHPEPAKQLAVADHVVLTKTDLVDQAGHAAAITTLRAINHAAPIVTGAAATAQALITDDDTATAEQLRGRFALTDDAMAHHHCEGVQTLALRYESPMDWTAFGVWLTLLLNRHGDKILRVKGLLNIAELPGPVLINGVQHIVHPPQHLPAWPSPDHSSRIIIIASGIERVLLHRSLDSFMP